MIAISSGGSFGFFMGIGMVMRAEMETKTCNSDDESSKSKEESVYRLRKIDPSTRELTESPMFEKYRIGV